MNSIKNIKLSKSINLSVVMCLFTYPLTSSYIYLLDINISSINIFFKLIVLIVYLVCFSHLVNSKGKLSQINISLFIILFLYSIRLLFDLFIFDISNPLYSTPYLLLYFFLLTFFPVYIIMKSGFYLKISKFIKYSGILLLIINVGYLLVTLNDGLSFEQIFASRVKLLSDDDSQKNIINPIVVGLYGVSLMLYSIYNILMNSKISLLGVIMILLGLFNLAVSASRGPFAILIILLLLMFFVFIRKRKVGFRNFLGIFSFFLIIAYVIIPLTSKYDFFLIQRIEKFFLFEEETRNFIIESAINDFLNNPIFGSHIFDSVYNAFPHNKIVEALMACGFLGGLFMMLSFIPFFKNIYKVGFKNIYNDYLWMFFILTPFILIGFLSGSFWSMPEFWVCLSLLSINPNKFNYV